MSSRRELVSRKPMPWCFFPRYCSPIKSSRIKAVSLTLPITTTGHLNEKSSKSSTKETSASCLAERVQGSKTKAESNSLLPGILLELLENSRTTVQRSWKRNVEDHIGKEGDGGIDVEGKTVGRVADEEVDERRELFLWREGNGWRDAA